jgi:Spx/MgsR family transcriptional regulator
MTTLYGIKNCDTVRKARRWLDDKGVEYRFHDLRRDGLDRKTLLAWERQLGWERLLNRRGTTWRKLPQQARDGIDRARALEIMLEYPAIIKRPLLAVGSEFHAGFTPPVWQEIFD